MGENCEARLDRAKAQGLQHELTNRLSPDVYPRTFAGMGMRSLLDLGLSRLNRFANSGFDQSLVFLQNLRGGLRA